MSTNANAMPDYQTAHDNLVNGIKAQVFFSKCAAAGWQPNTVEEAELAMANGAKLRMIKDAEVAKAAQDQNSPLAQMSAALDQSLAAYGIGQSKQAQDVEVAIRAAARQLATNPTLYNSGIAIKAAEAQAIAQRYGV